MLPALFVIACLAFEASATSCAEPQIGIGVDRRLLAGIWWIQSLYGTPPLTDDRCYNVKFSVNDRNRWDLIENWKDKNNLQQSLSTPEVYPSSVSLTGPRSYDFLIKESTQTVWFLQLDYNTYFATYGCNKGQNPVVFIATRKQERNETLINEVTESISKLVTLPEGSHKIDQTNCS